MRGTGFRLETIRVRGLDRDAPAANALLPFILPGALRRGRRVAYVEGSLKLTLSYRAPLAWIPLLRGLGCEGPSYERRIQIEGNTGTVVVENSPASSRLIVRIADSLLPVLMPLIAGLRRVFDLDAEPAVIGAHLAERGLAALVERWPGVRVPGRFDGFVSPDEFTETGRRLQQAAGVTSAKALLALAEQWRPWRAYAAQLLWLGSAYLCPLHVRSSRVNDRPPL